MVGIGIGQVFGEVGCGRRDPALVIDVEAALRDVVLTEQEAGQYDAVIIIGEAAVAQEPRTTTQTVTGGDSNSPIGPHRAVQNVADSTTATGDRPVLCP